MRCCHNAQVWHGTSEPLGPEPPTSGTISSSLPSSTHIEDVGMLKANHTVITLVPCQLLTQQHNVEEVGIRLRICRQHRPAAKHLKE